MFRHAFLPVALLLVVAVFPPTRSEDCADQRNYATRLTIDSRRNDSGHWVSQVELVHADSGERQGEAWTVDVHQRTSNCGGGSGNAGTGSDDSDGSGRSHGFVVVGATLVSPRLKTSSTNWTLAELVMGPEVRVEGYGSFRLSATPLPWERARRTCEARGAQLAEVQPSTVTTMRIVMRIMRVDMAYLGLHRSPSADHKFVTISGQPLETSEAVKWAHMRPATTGPLALSACGAIQADGTLQDVVCDNPLAFFCRSTGGPEDSS